MDYLFSSKQYSTFKMPSKAELTKIRKEHEPLLRGEMSWRGIDETAERLTVELGHK